MELPGITDLSEYKKDNPQITSLCNTTSINDRKVILIASNDISETNLFLNGLNQNILVLYDLFEALGYSSYLIQNSKTSISEKDKFLNRYKVLVPEDIIKSPMKIHTYIEIGMSLDSVTRSYLRSIGARIVKLYLGNILNIDIETIQNTPSIFFNHHIVGELDDIWMSPHYKQNLEYGVVLNQLPVEKGKIVPYVWSPNFINYFNTKHFEWQPEMDWKKTDIVIMDPNISFQKAYFYALLLAEAFYKKHKEWKGKVILINGDRIDIQSHAKNDILPNLQLYKEGRIKLEPRKSIHQVLKENPSAAFITSQWNNAFNYMTLELMYSGFPIIHNSDGWEYGYYYSLNRIEEAVSILYGALKDHRYNIQIYKTHATNLIWKHSIYNPEIQEEWKNILEK
jgi:hypothetical protein